MHRFFFFVSCQTIGGWESAPAEYRCSFAVQHTFRHLSLTSSKYWTILSSMRYSIPSGIYRWRHLWTGISCLKHCGTAYLQAFAAGAIYGLEYLISMLCGAANINFRCLSLVHIV